MDPGTEIAAGVALGIMATTVKQIASVAKQVKANKKTINELSATCTDKHFELQQITNEMKNWHDVHRARLIDEHVRVFRNLLDKILKDLESWAKGDFWARITHRGEIANQIRSYYEDITSRHLSLTTQLQTQTFANTAESLRHQQRTSMEIKDIKNTLEQQTRQQYVMFYTMMQQDSLEEARHMDRTRMTIENVGEGYDLSESHEIYPNVMADPQAVMRGLQRVEPDEESYMRAAREALLKALKGRGNRPLYTMDSSELTVPVKVHHGGHAVILQGIRDGEPVAIKQLNFEISSPDAALKRITRESKIWEQLDHKNIVPFVGVCAPKGSIPLMVSRWMPNGNARTYVRERQNRYESHGDVPKPDCIKIFIDIADGLCYLHSQSPQVIHGGLKASNILIDEEHNARITDFALSAIESEVQSGSRPPPMRWSAPEVLDGEENSPTADIYSFACVMLEIITDREPFHGQNHLFFLHRKIREGLRPAFPTGDMVWNRGLTSPECKLWKLMQACWAARPEARPAAHIVRQTLEEVWEERQRRP